MTNILTANLLYEIIGLGGHIKVYKQTSKRLWAELSEQNQQNYPAFYHHSAAFLSEEKSH